MVTGIHHFSFSVTNLDRTIEFYTKVLGVKLQSRGHNKYDTLGTALFGTKWGVTQQEAELERAVVNNGGTRVEFREYKNPETGKTNLSTIRPQPTR